MRELSKQQAQDLAEELEALRVNPAYQVVMERIADKLAQDRRLLEGESIHGSLLRLQGRVQARREALMTVEDLIRELNNYMERAP